MNILSTASQVYHENKNTLLLLCLEALEGVINVKCMFCILTWGCFYIPGAVFETVRVCAASTPLCATVAGAIRWGDTKVDRGRENITLWRKKGYKFIKIK